MLNIILIYYHLHSTVKRERFFAQVYFTNETVFQTTVLTGPMKMFRLEHETMNVCQRNVALTTFFRVLEAWCHCDFRKMEALKVNKFGRTYRTETQGAQVIVVRSYYFLNLYENVQLAKRDLVTAAIYHYITTEFHYAKDDSRLLTYGGVGTEVSYFCYKNITKISAKMSINVFLHT